MRCEGWRRRGGAFTLGPVTWKQCDNDAIVSIAARQDGKLTTQPSCLVCWNEALETGIEIASVTPLQEEDDRHMEEVSEDL